MATRRGAGAREDWLAQRWTWFQALLLPLIILAWLAVLIVLVWLVAHVSHALLVLVLSALIAFAVTPLVHLFARWIPRPLAILAAYLVAFAIVVGLVGAVVGSVASDIVNLVHSLPAYAATAEHAQPAIARLLQPLGVSDAQISGYRQSALAYLQQAGSAAARGALGAATSILGAVVDAVLVVILSVYLTANGPALTRWLQQQTPTGERRRTRELITIVNQVAGGYVRGTLIMATLIGVLVTAGMFALHVRYALLLGVVAFFMEFVPVLGVFISGALCIAVALFQGWVVAVLVVIYFAIVHVIEGDVVGPRVMGRAVGVHPAVALLALVAGTELFGLWGALFGAPLAGLTQSIATAVWREVRVASPLYPDRPPRT